MQYFFVYILASKRNGTLYTGSTDDLMGRIWEHKNKIFEGFTNQYSVHQLVWYEPHDTHDSAFTRERQIKEWKRQWEIELIEKMNPQWNDLFDTLNH